MLAIPFIWSTYKANLFLKNKYSYHFLLLCVNMLLENNLKDKKINLISDIEKLCIIDTIKQSTLVRQDKINNQLIHFELNFRKFNEISNNNTIDVIGKGRIAILDYLNDLEEKQITEEMILFLDAFRMVLKESDIRDYDKLNNTINHVTT